MRAHSASVSLGVILLAAASLPARAQDTPPAPAPAPAPATTAAAAPSPDLQAAKDAFKQGQWQNALDAALKSLAAQPKDLESLYIAGASERQTGKLADAEGHLKTLVEASPSFPLAHFQLGYVIFLRAEGMMREGQVDAAKSRYIEASEEFKTELARQPTHGASLSSRAIALSRAGKIDESVEAHEAWIAGAPQKNDPVVSLAATYAGAGRATDAMSTLDRVPDKSPKAVFDSMMAASSVFAARRDWAAAVPFLEKAVATDATSTKARALLVEACARGGLTDDAVRHLQVLLTMEPAPEEAEAVGEAIKATMGDGKSSPSIPGLEPPAVLRIPAPKYPKGQDESVKTDVLVLTQIREDGVVMNTVLIPNRIWKDMRTSGYEAAAFDAVKRGKFAPGTKGGKPAPLWVVVDVKFDNAAYAR